MADACCSCEDIRKIIKEAVKEEFDKSVEKLKATSGKEQNEHPVNTISSWETALKKAVTSKPAL